MGALFARLFYSSVKVNNRRYYIVKQIGEGGYSFVYLVKDGRGSRFALKKMLLQLPEHEDSANQEISAHQAVRDKPGVMQLVDHELKVSRFGQSEALLVFPFYSKGNVQEFVDKATLSSCPVPEKRILQWSICLCNAVAAFHDHIPPLAHRDIKPHNLLLADDLQNVVLMDLGSVAGARKHVSSRTEALDLQEQCAQFCTAPYRAPELFEVASECEITEKTDIWSLGCTVYAMAFGQSPCDGSATSTCSGSIRFPLNHGYSDAFTDLILWILKTDPQQRPSVDQIRQTMTGQVAVTVSHDDVTVKTASPSSTVTMATKLEL